MQIFTPELYTKTQAEALVKHYSLLLVNQPFLSEYYSRIKKVDKEELYKGKYVVKIYAHDKYYSISLKSCAEYLKIKMPLEYLEENNII
ncbi:hypothetical protein Q763_10020 [Flavobacterium beibuense F44-8]|uniref:Uncharacterized protein n=1 Tax=Flavobacterium beibuense F44-8 TaxID=1406840 RepID=A0A0A2LKS2_9FLAO|nr:hypothetical protein [Flavobacterium beibuense]KGO80857.1 hypothetical protein Q763_10020 [Flavobacterium beibuense F44-8]